MTGASLRGPLARALDELDYVPGPLTSVDILAALRSDPEVLAAMAEATHHVYCAYSDHTTQTVLMAHSVEAAAILDALLGAGSAAEGAEK